MLTNEDKKWLGDNLATKDDLKNLATKLRAEIAQLRVDLMDEMARVYRDLNRRVVAVERHLDIKDE